jgi:hypothetical protein
LAGELSFILPFTFAEHLHCCYIYFHCSSYLCTITIINYFEPCVLNVEFQHFILRFNKHSLPCLYYWKRG